MSIALVYNTCGLSGKENFDHYRRSIDSILNQNDKDFNLVISDCMSSEETRQQFLGTYRKDQRVSYCFIDDILPVNITFNCSVLDFIERWGPRDGYMYIDSGVDFCGNPDIIGNSYELFKRTNAGMLHLWSDDDNGLYVGGWGVDWLDTEKDYIVVLIGKACNLHCQVFSHKLVEFYGKPYGDVHAGQCSESTFSFVCAALRLNWVISKDIKVNHIKGVDGASFGFSRKDCLPWQNLMPGSRSALDIITDPVGIAAGFGYEENQNVLVHDSDQFDENGFCKNNVLKHFIRENLFLPKSALDYNKINRKFIS